MTKEETAIEKIYQMEQDIDYIKQYLELIDNNLKLLHNKIGKLKGISSESNKPRKITATPGTPLPPQEKTPRRDSDKLVLGKIKAFGYIVNKSKQPISGVEVHIYDDNGEVVKRRKTDNDGHWNVRLPAGKYGVEYIQEGYRPINRTMLLDVTMKSFEVR